MGTEQRVRVCISSGENVSLPLGWAGLYRLPRLATLMRAVRSGIRVQLRGDVARKVGGVFLCRARSRIDVLVVRSHGALLVG
jgi:hypothetical protein